MERYGIPVVDSGNILSVVKERGIKPWSHVRPPMSMEDYMKCGLSPERMEEVEKFALKTEVVFLKQPNNKKPFNGFRSKGEDGVIAFTILKDDLVLIVAEFVHGGEIIRLKPPAGFFKDKEGVSPLARAKEEVREETGLVLEDNEIVPLTPKGIHDKPRRLTIKEYYFLARPESPVNILPPKPDATEIVQPLLINLSEWLKTIKMGIVSDSASITATMLYLLEIGKI